MYQLCEKHIIPILQLMKLDREVKHLAQGHTV